MRSSIAGIAQLVEHNLAKVGVASSNLVSRSKHEKDVDFIHKSRRFLLFGVHLLPPTPCTQLKKRLKSAQLKVR
jgi:hypothetical protein